MSFSGQHGKEAEDRTEHILSGTFFRDFVFRSPQTDKKNKNENADVLVVFDDVILVVQSKSQAATKAPHDWLKKNLSKAIRQVGGAINSLNRGKVPCLENAFQGKIAFNREQYRYIYGLVIIDQPREVIDVTEYVAPFTQKFKTALQVMSLADFREVCLYFNTAMDFLHYYDVRNSVGGSTKIGLHEEPRFLHDFIDHFTELTVSYMKAKGEKASTTTGLLATQKLLGAMRDGNVSEEYKYSLLIDQIIGHLHETDHTIPDLFEKPKEKKIFEESTYTVIAHELAKTSRRDRIKLGSALFNLRQRFDKDEGRNDRETFIESRTMAIGYYFYMPMYGRPRRETICWTSNKALRYAKEKDYLRRVVAISIETDQNKKTRNGACMITRINQEVENPERLSH